MFYSQSLLSKKGPLGNVWMAAYCFKRLKKGQIASTDISSSIDKIHAEVQMSYRVLAHLLLGIVRIYSWKVEYLYKDCEEVLTLINHWGVPKGHGGKHCRSFVFGKEVIRRSTRNVTSAEKEVAEPMETMLAPYHHVTITAPERLELDAFELEDMDEAEKTTKLQRRSKIQDELIVKNPEAPFPTESYQKVKIVPTEFNSACFTPVHDVLPSDMMNTDLDINEMQNLSLQEGKRHGSQGDFWDLVEFGNHEGPGPRVSLSSNLQDEEQEHQIDISDLPGVAPSDINQDIPDLPEVAPSDFNQDIPDLPEVAPSDINQDIPSEEPEKQQRPQELHVKLLIEHEKSPDLAEGHIANKSSSPRDAGLASPKITVSTPAKREQHKLLRKRKGLFDETIVLSNETLRQAIHDASGLVCKRRKLPHTALDAWKSYKIANLERSFVDPLIPFIAPDLSALLLKRSTNPPTRKKRKFVNQEVDVRNVTRDDSDLEGPIEKRDSVEFPAPASPHGVPTTSELYDVPGNVLDLEEPIAQQTAAEIPPPECHLGVPATSEVHDIGMDVDLEVLIQVRTAAETPAETPERESHHEISPTSKLTKGKVPEASTKETSDSGSDLMDLELGTLETSSNNQDDGWPPRTRVMVQYLHNRFLNPKEQKEKNEMSFTQILEGKTRVECARYFYAILELGTLETSSNNQDDGWSPRTQAMVQYLHNRFLNPKEQKEKNEMSFTQILVGKTRVECARYFYEILCLKDRACQDSPYRDIIILPTPQLNSMFQKLS